MKVNHNDNNYFLEATKYLYKRKKGGALISSLEQTLKSRLPNITEDQIKTIIKNLQTHKDFTVEKGFILYNHGRL